MGRVIHSDRWRWRGSVFFAVLFLTAPMAVPLKARAHGVDNTYSEVRLSPDRIEWDLRVPAALLLRAVPVLRDAAGEPFWSEKGREALRAFESYLRQHVGISVGRTPCLSDIRRLWKSADGKFIHVDIAFRCLADSGRVTLVSSLFEDVSIQHRHLSKITGGGGGVREIVFGPDRREMVLTSGLTPSLPWGETVLSFVKMGVRHILCGWDHLVFVFGLLLAARARVRAILKAVSSFTVAHSLTLALAVLGVITVRQEIVEPLIAASVAYIGLENLYRQTGRRRPFGIAAAAAHACLVLSVAAGLTSLPLMVAVGMSLFSFSSLSALGQEGSDDHLTLVFPFLVGLVHGLGFAGPLLELALPRRELILSLFSFNTGVELGQLALVAVCVPCLAGIMKRIGPDRVVLTGSTAVLAIGVVWLVVRIV